MKKFDAIEDEFKLAMVSDPNEPTVSGALSLAGRKSSVILGSDQLKSYSTDENGWFDLTLVGSDGRFFHLKDALEVAERTHQLGGRYEKEIYPNIVVIGHQPDIQKIKAINFQLEGLKHFFTYEFFERHEAYKAPPAFSSALKNIRSYSAKRGFPKEYPFFRPYKVIVQHRMPRVFKFVVGDKYYQLDMLSTEMGRGYNGVNIFIEPTARISFATPVDINTAMEAMWQWQQYFVLVAMHPMEVTAASIECVGGTRRESSLLYIPGRNKPKEADRGWLRPGISPFHRWDQRRNLARAMERWLLKSEGRAKFRAIISDMIRESREITDAQHVVRLCGAIESLEEIERPASITRAQLKKMAAAAAAAISGEAGSITEDKIKTVLGAFRRASLAAKISAVTGHQYGLFDQHDGELVLRAAHKIRNDVAHGKEHGNIERPTTGPVTRALLGFCVCYDLFTSDTPLTFNNRKLNAATVTQQSISQLKRLTPETVLSQSNET